MTVLKQYLYITFLINKKKAVIYVSKQEVGNDLHVCLLNILFKVCILPSLVVMNFVIAEI